MYPTLETAQDALDFVNAGNNNLFAMSWVLHEMDVADGLSSDPVAKQRQMTAFVSALDLAPLPAHIVLFLLITLHQMKLNAGAFRGFFYRAQPVLREKGLWSGDLSILLEG